MSDPRYNVHLGPKTYNSAPPLDDAWASAELRRKVDLVGADAEGDWWSNQTVMKLIAHIDAITEAYRKRFLLIATEAGEDTSGIEHPDQLVEPPIEDYALNAVRDLRESYDECLRGTPQR